MIKVNIQALYAMLAEEDKTISQVMDFNNWCLELTGDIEELYDMVMVKGNATFEEKAKLDLVYTCIGELVREGKKFIRNS